MGAAAGDLLSTDGGFCLVRLTMMIKTPISGNFELERPSALRPRNTWRVIYLRSSTKFSTLRFRDSDAFSDALEVAPKVKGHAWQRSRGDCNKRHDS